MRIKMNHSMCDREKEIFSGGKIQLTVLKILISSFTAPYILAENPADGLNAIADASG